MREIRMMKRKMTSAIAEVEGDSAVEIAQKLCVVLETDMCTLVNLGQGKQAVLMVAEERKPMSSNVVTLSIMFTDDGEYLKAVIVATGGSEDFWLLGDGPDDKAAARAEIELTNLGFNIVEIPFV